MAFGVKKKNVPTETQALAKSAIDEALKHHVSGRISAGNRKKLEGAFVEILENMKNEPRLLEEESVKEVAKIFVSAVVVEREGFSVQKLLGYRKVNGEEMKGKKWLNDETFSLYKMAGGETRQAVVIQEKSAQESQSYDEID